MTIEEAERLHSELSAGLDALLNSFIPADSATQRKIAALLHRSPTYFSNARPDPIAGAWRTSVGKKLALAKALDAKRAEIEKVKAAN